MLETYKDNPENIEKWLNTLSPSERILFDRGYNLALCGLLEQLCETKRRLLDKIVELEDSDDDHKLQLLSRLHILDVYEQHYEQRAKLLSKETELQPLKLN